MKKILAITLLNIFLVVPSSVFAAQLDFDAAIIQDSVKFSPSQFYAGEKVRIYMDLQNLGSQDIAGQVSFFQGPNLLRSPSTFLLRAAGVSQGVWIDWLPPEGTYNIMVKVDTDPADQNQTNNVYVTPMMTIGKRPVPPPPVVVQPAVISSSTQTSQVSTSSSLPSNQSQQEKKTIFSVAQNLAEKLTPKLPIAPSRTTSPAQKKKTGPSPQQIVGVLPNNQNQGGDGQQAPFGLVSIQSSDTDKTVVDQQNTKHDDERGFEKNIPQEKNLHDPARSFLAFAVVFVVVCLIAGGFFLKMGGAL